MSDAEQITALARERAEKRIDSALGDLKKAAREIGTKYGIPDGIAGHSIEELLGRIAYIPTMARDMRRACGQELAKQELANFLDDAAEPEGGQVLPPPIHQTMEPSKIPRNIPVGMDVGDLDGVTVQAINALRTAGLTKIGDVVNVPDEHLVKINGLGEKSVAHIRAAIAKASEIKDGNS